MTVKFVSLLIAAAMAQKMDDHEGHMMKGIYNMGEATTGASAGYSLEYDVYFSHNRDLPEVKEGRMGPNEMH